MPAEMEWGGAAGGIELSERPNAPTPPYVRLA